MSAPEPIVISRRIAAPAAAIFAVIADPARHPEIDGTGMVQALVRGERVTGTGDEFAMAMRNPDFGDYEMTSRVVTYEPDRAIAWKPCMTAATKPAQQEAIGTELHYLWGWELVPLDDGTTEVTERFDCTQSPAFLQEAVHGGQAWVGGITASLEKLASVVES